MLEMAIDARPADLGGGLAVARILPFRRRRMVGPFIFLDHAGPVVLEPEQARRADILPHPHIGLSTVSYLFDGQLIHRDSLGVEQAIRPGEVNWMTAGRGIAHSERFARPAPPGGCPLELVQAWVALPERDEECAPGFRHHPASTLPVAEADGTWLRLIAGEAFGLASPVETRSPLFYLHAELQAGARLGLPRGYAERAAYILRGRVALGGEVHGPGRMLVFGRDGDPVLAAQEPATLMLLGGEPLGERFIWWNFVSSRRERIEQAKADWQAGRIPLPPDDNAEFVPLPEVPGRPAPQPM